tara:strand:- start:1300 stop:1656 length:357 start_codon:yes stop_codon:yes gene_type:complete
METNKELLEATVKGLQDKLEQLQTELNYKTIELDNINKPMLNQSTMDVIYDCINDGIGEFDFNDNKNYDFEYELDYDGRINVCNIDFLNADYIAEPILKLIENKFNIINDTKDENKSI